MTFPIVSGKKNQPQGFTLIELMVVMAILALLLSIALPRYFQGLLHAKETVLREDLSVMRRAIENFREDKGIYPSNLKDLVSMHYIRSIPIDPITEHNQTWIGITAPDDPQHIIDVKSGSDKKANDGTRYSDW
jgi:general secretion pathway protein G